jgi:hypothetical protein
MITVIGTPVTMSASASTTMGRSAMTAMASTAWSVSRRSVSVRSLVVPPCQLARFTQYPARCAALCTPRRMRGSSYSSSPARTTPIVEERRLLSARATLLGR